MPALGVLVVGANGFLGGYIAATLQCAVAVFLVRGCWLTVLWLEVRARNLAIQAAARVTPLPVSYRATMRWWYALGCPAFLAVMAIFWLVVFKPV